MVACAWRRILLPAVAITYVPHALKGRLLTRLDQVPSSADELRSKGYNHYHCYSSGQIALFQAYLALDAAHAIESAAVIWDGAHHIMALC